MHTELFQLKIVSDSIERKRKNSLLSYTSGRISWNEQSSLLSRFSCGLCVFPVRSPLLRESLLISFPPLNDMLKFSGCPHSFEVGILKFCWKSGKETLFLRLFLNFFDRKSSKKMVRVFLKLFEKKLRLNFFPNKKKFWPVFFWFSMLFSVYKKESRKKRNWRKKNSKKTEEKKGLPPSFLFLFFVSFSFEKERMRKLAKSFQILKKRCTIRNSYLLAFYFRFPFCLSLKRKETEKKSVLGGCFFCLKKTDPQTSAPLARTSRKAAAAGACCIRISDAHALRFARLFAFRCVRHRIRNRGIQGLTCIVFLVEYPFFLHFLRRNGEKG